MVKIQNPDNIKCWQKCGITGTLIHRFRQEYKTAHPLWKTVWQFLTNLNIHQLYNPAVMFPDIYPKELKTYVYTETCTQMFIAALFIIAKTWKQPRCPSAGKWINAQCQIQTMEYYTTLKRIKLSSHEKTWRKLKCMLLHLKKTF